MPQVPGIETGYHFSEQQAPSMPGHHETVDTLVRCLCCGHEQAYLGTGCVCQLAVNWHQNEAREVACALHLQEKVKDGLFRL